MASGLEVFPGVLCFAFFTLPSTLSDLHLDRYYRSLSFHWLLCIRWGFYPTSVKKIMVALSCVNISTENVFGLNFQFAVPTIYRGIIKVRSMGIRIPSEMNERVGMVRLKKTLATITSDRVSFACHASTLEVIQSRIYWLPLPAPAPAPRPAPPPPIMLRAL